ESPRSLGRLLHVIRLQRARAIRIQVQRGTRRIDVDAPPAKSHVAPDRLSKHREHVGTGGRAETWRELLRDAGAADDVSPLEDQDPEARSRESEPGDESVVPRSDGD